MKEVNEKGYLVDEHIVMVTDEDKEMHIGSVNIGNCDRLSDFLAKAPTLITLYNIRFPKIMEDSVIFLNKNKLKSVQPLKVKGAAETGVGGRMMEQNWYLPPNDKCQKCGRVANYTLRRVLRTSTKYKDMLFAQWECESCARHENY